MIPNIPIAHLTNQFSDGSYTRTPNENNPKTVVTPIWAFSFNIFRSSFATISF